MAQDRSNLAKIQRWGRKFVFPFDEAAPRAAKMNLVHRAVNGKSADVQLFTVPALQESEWKTLAEEINEAVNDDASGLKGSQSYILTAIDGGEIVLSRLALRCSMEDETDDDDSISSEPATSKGVLAMLMKHTEALHRNSTMGFASIIRGQQAMLDQQATLIEKFGERHIQLINQTESLASQQHERELASTQTAAEIENRTMMIQRFTGLLGPIVKKFTGLTDPSDLPVEVTELQDFLGGLTEQEVEALKLTLPPDKVFILLSLMEKNATREEQGKSKNGVLPT
jgi:hypothetical protein